MVECLCGEHEALGCIFSTAYRQGNMLAISALRIWKKEDEKFRNILDYLASLRPAWAIDPFLKNNQNKIKQYLPGSL